MAARHRRTRARTRGKQSAFTSRYGGERGRDGAGAD